MSVSDLVRYLHWLREGKVRIKSKPRGRLLLVDMREEAAILGAHSVMSEGEDAAGVLGWGIL